MRNAFLDKLAVCNDQYLKDLRTFGIGLDRDQLSAITGISTASIRRYESNWKNSKPPKWYQLLLRFMSGDLSYFGNYWQDCRIHPEDRKLQSPHFPHERLTPMDMHMKHNQLFLNKNRQVLELKEEIQQLERKLDIALTLNAELELQKELLEIQLKRTKIIKDAENKGKVVKLFKES